MYNNVHIILKVHTCFCLGTCNSEMDHFTVNIMTDYIHSSDTCAKTRLYLIMKTCDYGSSHNNDKTAAAVARLWAGHRHLRTMA